MKKKITILACSAIVLSAAAFMGYKAYQNFVTPDFLTENIEALTNNEANVTLVNCFKEESVNEDRTSADKISICPDGTTDYKIGKCSERQGTKRFMATVAGKCITK